MRTLDFSFKRISEHEWDVFANGSVFVGIIERTLSYEFVYTDERGRAIFLNDADNLREAALDIKQYYYTQTLH